MPIQSAQDRQIIIELYLGIRDEVIKHYFPKGDFGQPSVPVFGMVLLTHIRNGKATASSVARGLGIKRDTARRRLQELEALGLVERRGNGYCATEIVNAPKHRAIVPVLKKLIRGAARKLSPD